MEQAFCFEATTTEPTTSELDYSNPEAHQAVSSVVYLVIFGAIHHTLHGLEKFSVQIVRRISQYKPACHGFPYRLAGRGVVAIAFLWN